MSYSRSTSLCLSLLVTASGCVENDASIFVQQVQISSPENECLVTNDPSAGSRLGGLIDVAMRSTYNAPLLVGNQLVPRGDPDRLRTETGRVQLFEADVEIYADGALVASYTQPIVGFADVGSGANPGYGLTAVALVNPDTAEAVLAAGAGVSLVSRVKLRGETLGGLEVESGEWDYPISTCECCTPIFEPMTNEDERIENCNIGQDGDTVDRRDIPLSLCPAVCSDGLDNDGDGQTDFDADLGEGDPECTFNGDSSET